METKTAISPGRIGLGVVQIYKRGKNISYGDKKVIIVTEEDLVASDTMEFDWGKINGIVTTKGTKNSHSAIVAKQHEVPAVIVSNISQFKKGDFIALDTYSSENGEIYYFPSKDEVRRLLDRLEMIRMQKENMAKYREDKTITKDGKKVFVVSNIGTIEELPSVKQNGAEGIGVVRTEFSYEMHDKLEGRLPTENELYEEYKKISNELTGKPVIIRTLDAGADKPVNSLIKAGVLKENEANPALGSRGIRPCLEQPEILKTQIKAIFRANSQNNNLKIMFPMITSIEELKKGKGIVAEAIKELKESGKEFLEGEIGIMVETPAIAQITDRLSNYCDFISVGTNDLTQYTTAADRMNNAVETIADPYNPGMIRILNSIISGAHNGKKSIMCGMCGEIAGDLEYIPILLGMGLDEFSMNSSSILAARRLISNLRIEECEELLNEILEKDTSTEIKDIAKKFYREHNLQILKQEKQQRKNQLDEVTRKEAEVSNLRDRYYKLTREKLPEYLGGEADDDEKNR